LGSSRVLQKIKSFNRLPGAGIPLIQRLIAARDREVARRRDIAERLAEKHDRGDTENVRISSKSRTQLKPSSVPFGISPHDCRLAGA
jgi:hypothetical protein